jgi:ceramide glucosyltransferase
VGAVSCLYVGDDGGGLWSHLSAMAIDYQFLPNAIVGKALGMAEPCFGSTIAITTRVLGEIGGFLAFANDLADDYEIGQAVRAKGYHVAIPPIVVAHACAESSARQLFDHELRWARTIRQIDGWGHAGSVVTHAIPLGLIGGALLGFPTWAIGMIATLFGLRLLLKMRIDAVTGAGAGWWWIIPARDVLSFVIFLASFAVNTVDWQGRRFRVGPDGGLTHL